MWLTNLYNLWILTHENTLRWISKKIVKYEQREERTRQSRGIKGNVLVSKRANNAPWFFGLWYWILTLLSRYKPHDRTNKTGTRVGPRERPGLSALGEERWPISRYSAHMPYQLSGAAAAPLHASRESHS